MQPILSHPGYIWGMGIGLGLIVGSVARGIFARRKVNSALENEKEALRRGKIYFEGQAEAIEAKNTAYKEVAELISEKEEALNQVASLKGTNAALERRLEEQSAEGSENAVRLRELELASEKLRYESAEDPEDEHRRKMEYDEAEHKRAMERMEKGRAHSLEDETRARQVTLEERDYDMRLRREEAENRALQTKEERDFRLQLASRLVELQPVIEGYLESLGDKSVDDGLLEKRREYREELVEVVLEHVDEGDGIGNELFDEERSPLSEATMDAINQTINARYPLGEVDVEMPAELKQLIEMVTGDYSGNEVVAEAVQNGAEVRGLGA